MKSIYSIYNININRKEDFVIRNNVDFLKDGGLNKTIWKLYYLMQGCFLVSRERWAENGCHKL